MSKENGFFHKLKEIKPVSALQIYKLSCSSSKSSKLAPPPLRHSSATPLSCETIALPIKPTLECRPPSAAHWLNPSVIECHPDLHRRRHCAKTAIASTKLCWVCRGAAKCWASENLLSLAVLSCFAFLVVAKWKILPGLGTFMVHILPGAGQPLYVASTGDLFWRT